MINLGFWQLRRLEERRDFNARVESRIDEPPMPIGDVTAGVVDALEWRSVEATGEYLPTEQLLVVNRSLQGSAGDIVVTPLQLPDGRILLVERGFAPLGVDPAEIAPAPAGTVEVVGRLRPPEVRRRGQLSDPPTGELDEAQRVDIERLAPQLPGPVVPAYIELVSSEPAPAGPFPQLLPEPELSEGPHLSYAGQWFLFAAAVVVGWVLAVRHSIKARRAGAAKPTAASPAPVDEPAEGVGAAPPSSPG
jgi:cytochrome oxidase assembly protein ShyY1